MTTLEHLTITNFRGFDFLEIDGLSKINLFIGKNNSGKTAVLEAVFLLLGMSNPMLPNNINVFRGGNTINVLKMVRFNQQDNTAKQLRYLFHNLSLENHPVFHGKLSDATERRLELSILFHVCVSHNVPAVYDVFAVAIRGREAFQQPQKCGWRLAWEWSEAQ